MKLLTEQLEESAHPAGLITKVIYFFYFGLIT